MLENVEDEFSNYTKNKHLLRKGDSVNNSQIVTAGNGSFLASEMKEFKTKYFKQKLAALESNPNKCREKPQNLTENILDNVNWFIYIECNLYRIFN